MSRPLLITDCDEVLLHMIGHFAEWVDEAHGLDFDISAPGFRNALLSRDGVPLPDPQLEARLAHYLQSRGATFLDWMADGSLLISTRFGETEQVHRVEAPLGQREQLTFYPDAIEWARAAKSA